MSKKREITTASGVLKQVSEREHEQFESVNDLDQASSAMPYVSLRMLNECLAFYVQDINHLQAR